MEYHSIRQLEKLCKTEKKPVWKIVLKAEQTETDETEKQIFERMRQMYHEMKAADEGYDAELRSASGMAGGDGEKMQRFNMTGKNLCSGYMALAMEKAEHSIGEMKEFYGNFLVVVKALTYLMTLGKEGIPEASQNAVLNANYMMNKLKDLYTMAYDEVCMHEFVMSLEDLKKKAGVSAMDIAKGLLDNGIHPPTMYFPLIVHEALMVEPTETESKEVLDHAIEVFRKLYNDALENPESLLQAPVTTPVTRMDEVEAARHPVLKYNFEA